MNYDTDPYWVGMLIGSQKKSSVTVYTTFKLTQLYLSVVVFNKLIKDN